MKIDQNPSQQSPEFPYATARAKVERWKDRERAKPRRAVFTSTASKPGAPGYRDRSGQTVDVLRALTRDEADCKMFKIRFADGVEADAFADEIEVLR